MIVDKSLTEKHVIKIKDQIGVWWLQLSDDEFNLKEMIDKSLYYFNNFFDSLFGRKHLSLKCLKRSIIGSLFWFSLLFSIYSLLDGVSSLNVYDSIGFVIIPFNLFADFLSLFQTRVFLKWAENKSILTVAVLLILDALTSMLIFIIVMFFVFMPFITVTGINYDPVSDYAFPFHFGVLLVSFFSTFFTGIMFLLFFFYSLLLVVLGYLRWPIRSMFEWLDSLKNPVTSIVGIIAGVIILIKGIQIL